MHRFLAAALIVVAFATPTAAEGWRSFEGMAAPEITASEWLHVPGGRTSVKALQGKAWLLIFFGIH